MCLCNSKHTHSGNRTHGIMDGPWVALKPTRPTLSTKVVPCKNSGESTDSSGFGPRLSITMMMMITPLNPLLALVPLPRDINSNIADSEEVALLRRPSDLRRAGDYCRHAASLLVRQRCALPAFVFVINTFPSLFRLDPGPCRARSRGMSLLFPM